MPEKEIQEGVIEEEKEVQKDIVKTAALIVGTLAVFGLVDASNGCDEIELNINDKAVCFTTEDYAEVKGALISELEENKDFDFSVESLPTLSAVLDYEVSRNPVTIENATPEKIRNHFIELLKK